MIPQELIDRGLKVGLSKEWLENHYNKGFNVEFAVASAEREQKSLEMDRNTPLTPQQEEFLKDLSWVDKPSPAPAETTTIKTTLIGNGFEVKCPKIVGTNLADHLVSHKIEVYEIRFPFNKFHTLIYGKLNPEVDIEEVVNTYCKEHGY